MKSTLLGSQDAWNQMVSWYRFTASRNLESSRQKDHLDHALDELPSFLRASGFNRTGKCPSSCRLLRGTTDVGNGSVPDLVELPSRVDSHGHKLQCLRAWPGHLPQLGSGDLPNPTLYVGNPMCTRSLVWCSLVFLGVPWCSLVFLGVPWCSLVFLGVPWLLHAPWCSFMLLGVPSCSWCSLVLLSSSWAHSGLFTRDSFSLA
ncbi:YALIA101S01e19306g1_1 [Yarrowia lipolytica]|nr:YALIA101S01e19306g1_1 [Yarrowia lipolytica]